MSARVEAVWNETNPFDVDATLRRLKELYLYQTVRFKEMVEDFETIIDADMIGICTRIVVCDKYEDAVVYDFQFDMQHFYAHNTTCMRPNWIGDDGEYNLTCIEANEWESKTSVLIGLPEGHPGNYWKVMNESEKQEAYREINRQLPA